MNIQARMSAVIERFGPVGAAVAAALLVILGILVIAFPALLIWAIGIALMLTGVALLAMVFTANAGAGAGATRRT